MNPPESLVNNDSSDSASAGGAGDPLQSPLTGSGTPAFDAVETTPESKIPPGLAVLLLVMLVGGGAIMLMRQFGLGAGYEFDNVTIDYPIDAMQASDSDDDYERVISDLTNHDVPHVELAELRPKPFELRGAPREEEDFAPVALETEEERLERERRQRSAMLQREFNKLELNSVIGGSSPIARISGIAVRPGDVVGGAFTVARISGRSVELEAEGRTYVLTMGR
jgi:hypothetical protein